MDALLINLAGDTRLPGPEGPLAHRNEPGDYSPNRILSPGLAHGLKPPDRLIRVDICLHSNSWLFFTLFLV